jgi:cell division protein FtsI/penicillin-binding protein 2
VRVAAPGIRLLEAAAWALALAFGWRLFTLQILDHDRYLALAVQQWQKEQPLPAPRGSLFDRAGTPLAVGTLQYKVTADPEAFQKRTAKDRQAILSLIAGQLGQSDAWLRRKLGGKSRYALLHDGLALGLEDRERLRATGVVHLEACSRRLYPMGALAGPLIGFVNDDDAGVCGLEAGLQSELAGQPGRELVQKDDRGQVLISPLNRVLVEPQRGRDVYLTIDHKAQAIADIELARAAADCGARAGSVVILDPTRGEILALASWPAVETRDEARFDPSEWKLLPVQALYEPGSTLKAVTSAALLERGQVTLTTQTDAEDGSAEVDGFTVRDDKPHPGYLTFEEAFALSSNICFAKLSRRLSKEDLYRVLQDSGFGNAYGLELPGEENGILRRRWGRSPIAACS